MKDRPTIRGIHLQHTGVRQVAPGQMLRRTSRGGREREKEKGNPDVTALGQAQVEQCNGEPQALLGGVQVQHPLKKLQKKRDHLIGRFIW